MPAHTQWPCPSADLVVEANAVPALQDHQADMRAYNLAMRLRGNGWTAKATHEILVSDQSDISMDETIAQEFISNCVISSVQMPKVGHACIVLALALSHWPGPADCHDLVKGIALLIVWKCCSR